MMSLFNSHQVFIYFDLTYSLLLPTSLYFLSSLPPLPPLLQSYKHTKVEAPDCTGGPMYLNNKFSGELKIGYTYSVQFVVGF